MALSPSVAGGAQVEMAIQFLLHEGNWWLFVNGSDDAHAIGYYPGSLYAGGPLATGAAEIDYGGETYPDNGYPPMGSGQFADQGEGKAAYQRNIEYSAGSGFNSASLIPNATHPTEYTIAVANSGIWAETFFFGGPGGPP